MPVAAERDPVGLVEVVGEGDALSAANDQEKRLGQRRHHVLQDVDVAAAEQPDDVGGKDAGLLRGHDARAAAGHAGDARDEVVERLEERLAPVHQHEKAAAADLQQVGGVCARMRHGGAGP